MNRHFKFVLKCICRYINSHIAVWGRVIDMSVSHQFQTLDKLVESAAQLCKNGASSEVQVGAMLSVCEELQHILRYAFIGGCR